MRERTAEAVGLIWDMLPVTEKTKDEIDFSKVPEGVRYNLQWTCCWKFPNMNLFMGNGPLLGEDQPIPSCLQPW